MDDDHLAIGRFSAQTRISVRMLRHYHQHEILVPARVDDTGHRRYSTAQLADAAFVRQLRDVGFSVAAMAALLASRDTPALARALSAQRAVLERERDAATDRLAVLTRMIDTLEGHPMATFDISRRRTPARTVVTYRDIVPTYADEGMLWQTFMPEIARHGIVPVGPGGVFEHNEEFTESDVDESVFLPVAPGTVVAAPLTVHEVPEQDAVVARVVGPYSQIGDAHVAISEYLATNGLADAEPAADGLVGVHFSVYLTDPTQVGEEETVTEVHRIVRPAA
jgi:DNA-binding transcriptional MerR regulator